MKKLNFKLISVLFVILLANKIFAQDDVTKKYYNKKTDTYFLYKKPTTFEFLPNAFKDLWQFNRVTFRKEKIPILSEITLSTLLLYYYDEELIDGAKDIGRTLNIPSKDKMVTAFSITDKFPVRLPGDIGASLYFIGDGITHLSIMGTFLGYGLLKDNTRALRTASQLSEGLFTVMVITQTLKHITGRQSPFKSTQERGRWDLFPNQEEYHKHVPSYDAFPSGHLATAMVTVTVLSDNYPEYSFIKPVGYSLMTLLAFQMLNNGVHWASDYPLALYIGYTCGKLATSRGREEYTTKEIEEKKIIKSASILPYRDNDILGIKITLSF